MNDDSKTAGRPASLPLRLDREKLRTFAVQTGVKAGPCPGTIKPCLTTKGIVIGI